MEIPMPQINWITLSALGAVALMVLSGSAYRVPEAQQALITQFGEIKHMEREPGLHFKLPMVQDVQLVDKRLLDYNAEPREVITKDSERIIVDAFVRYRITNPVQYYVAVRNEQTMNNRLGALLESSLRQVFSSVQLKTVLSEDRVKLMARIRDVLNTQVHGTSNKKTAANAPEGGYGIEIVDVRVMRADLPPENSEAVYSRMRTEREREAREFRARGTEEALKIRSEADRERVVLVAEARKKAALLRGEGDATAARIYNEAIGADPEFFSLWRSLQAYRATLDKDSTSIVLNSGRGFLKDFEQGAR
jgi:modulator of FtsH protease HflC